MRAKHRKGKGLDRSVALDPKRCAGAFLALNCAALNAGRRERAVRVHARGAFTGADRARAGLFRAARRGGRVVPGRDRRAAPACRPSCFACCRNGRSLGLGEDRSNGDRRARHRRHQPFAGGLGPTNRFRADLYHRLSVVSLRLPPLRERREDLPALSRISSRSTRACLSACSGLGADFLEALAGLELPGNARQLENLVRRALLPRATAGRSAFAICRTRSGWSSRRAPAGAEASAVRNPTTTTPPGWRSSFSLCGATKNGVCRASWRRSSGSSSRRR